MKKFWPLVLVTVISIIGLSVYYGDQAKALHTKREFQFDTLQGDDKYIQDVLFETTYQEDRVYQNYFVTPTSSEVVKGINHRYNHNYDMQNLFEEHKSFFRAKQFNGRHYYNDDQSIAYVYINDPFTYENPQHVQYEVAVYNKDSEKQDKYKLVQNVGKTFLWQTVEWVNYNDEQLKVLSIRTYEGQTDELILTTFDLQKETVQETVLIEPIYQLHLNLRDNTDSYNSDDYAVIQHYNNDESEGVSVQTYYLFDATTNEIAQIDFDIKASAFDYETSLQDHYLVATKTQSQTINVKLYDVETKKWQYDYNVDLQLKPESNYVKTHILSDKLYVTYEVDQGQGIEVFEVNTGENLYSGLMTAKDAVNEHDIYFYLLHEQ